MANPRIVLLESDDGMHPNTGEVNFNESAYYNFYDPVQRLGGFVRVGNRPNEHYAEMSVCLQLPDGRIAFMYRRPEISDNVRLAAGGLAFEVRVPFREHRIRYDDTCFLLADPMDLLDPRRAFAENPRRPLSLELTYEGLSPIFGGERRKEYNGRWASVPEDRALEFARGHLEQHGRAVGRIVVGGTEYAVDARGLRDHSWGPRYWQAPRYYRWLTMSFGTDAGISAAVIMQRDGQRVDGGYLYRHGEPNRNLMRVEIETTYAEPEGLHDRIFARLEPVDGGAVEEVEGRVLRMVPLRNRRGGVTTRIAEGLTEWRWAGRVGYGWSEYLDHTG